MALPETITQPLEVSTYYQQLPKLVEKLKTEVVDFQGSKITFFKQAWYQITSDPDILNLITGTKIEFECDTDELPALLRWQPSMNASEDAVTDSEVENLLRERGHLRMRNTLSRR